MEPYAYRAHELSCESVIISGGGVYRALRAGAPPRKILFSGFGKTRDEMRGALKAIMSAGAYGFAMASNDNARARAAEVLVQGDRYTIVRRRETCEDLVAGETTA